MAGGGDQIDRLQGSVYTNKHCNCLEMPVTTTPANTDSVETDGHWTQVIPVASQLHSVHGRCHDCSCRANTTLHWAQLTALRFTNIFIPPGALIGSARIVFYPTPESISRPEEQRRDVTMGIRAAYTGNAPTLDCVNNRPMILLRVVQFSFCDLYA